VTDNFWVLKGRCYKVGDNFPHAGGLVPLWVTAGRVIEPDKVIPHLFEDIDPGFHERCQPGDVVVGGKNFGMSPKMNGYVAMQALGLGLVCESMPFLAYRAAVGVGLRVMATCENVTDLCETGDRIEVDFKRGRFVNHSRGIERSFPPVPEALIDIIEVGGNTEWLRRWQAEQGKMAQGEAAPGEPGPDAHDDTVPAAAR
jgi:3-isopropylmalate/(R)-2-methylmalate dehydratase small subunit